jgi:predicted transcriptional regulator
LSSNQDIIKNIVAKHPGLRFHEIKKETKLANGTLQHHLSKLENSKTISTKYLAKIPRYYNFSIKESDQVILLRLRQNTTSKIIKSLLKKECQSFSQLVKQSKKSAGTVSLYKNMLLQDKIIVGDTNECPSCPDAAAKIKYRLVDVEKVRILVSEYGKSSLTKSADNLADIFLSIK